MKKKLEWTVTPEKWAEELQKTKKEQCKGALREEDPDGFCCLGILADMQDPEAWEGGYDDEQWSWNGEELSLGLAWSRPPWLSTKQEEMAQNANDDSGWDFPKIGRWVEAGMKQRPGRPTEALDPDI